MKLNNLEFDDHHVYLIDDIEKNTLYIWVGLEVPQYKKDLTAAWARRSDKDRGGACKILIMMQKREYGSFLSMMDQLKKGLIPGKSTERRPELVLLSPTDKSSDTTEEENKEIKEDIVDSGTVAWLKQLVEYRKPFTEELTEEKVLSIEEPEYIDIDDIFWNTIIHKHVYYLFSLLFSTISSL